MTSSEPRRDDQPVGWSTTDLSRLREVAPPSSATRLALLRSLAISAEPPGRGERPHDGVLRGAGWRRLGSVIVRVTMSPGFAREVWVHRDGVALLFVETALLGARSYFTMMSFLDDGGCW